MDKVNELLDRMEVILENVRQINKEFKMKITCEKTGGGTTNRWQSETVGM